MDRSPLAERPSSAFSRLANYYNPSTSAAAAAAASSSLSSSNASGQSGSAQEALEALAAGRVRTGSTSGRRPQTSRSRSREGRSRPSPSYYLGAESPILPGAGFESPELIANSTNQSQKQSRPRRQSTSASGFWGGETLPSNASYSASAFSTFAPGSAFTDASHFFPSGQAGFSFEGSRSFSPGFSSGSVGIAGGGAGTSSYQNRDRVSREPAVPEESSTGHNSWESFSASAMARARGLSPLGLAGTSRFGSSPTRSMKHYISGGATGDRGLVAIAKPKTAGDGRIAVAGKTYLKVLKIPPLVSASADLRSAAASSSLASRRSRSRGSPVPLASRSPDSNTSERETITEIMDVRAGAKLGPGHLFTNVSWGYGDSENRLATSFSNGVVALWDLQKEAPYREKAMPQHDRAVNDVTFGGPAGNYLLSGGQDGLIKIWDTRAGKANTNKLKASSPVQRIKFSPSASHPWTLLAVCTSGTLIRFDLRNLGSTKPAGAMTDRIAGHVGAVLALDWRDNYESDGAERKDGGWVVTAGMDKTIKIWDFSLPQLSTRPVRTLYSSQPIQDVTWHPTRGTELATSPLLALSASTTWAEESKASSSAVSLGGEPVAQPPKPASWKNEIAIWDTRRPSFPRQAITTSEPVSAITYNDDATLWCASKSKAVFEQFDIQRESYDLAQGFPKCSTAWTADGELVFAGVSRLPDYLNSIKHDTPVDAPAFNADASLSSVPRVDPDFSFSTFTYLANTLVLTSDDFASICDQNAEAYESVNRYDASQIWGMLKIWLGDPPVVLPDSPPPTPPEEPDRDPALIASQNLHDWLRSPTSTIETYTPPSRAVSRRSLSQRPAQRARSLQSSPVILPSDMPTPTYLDAFSEESTSSEAEQPKPEEVETSDSEQERVHRVRSSIGNHWNGATGPLHKSVTSLATIRPIRGRSSTLSGYASLASPASAVGDDLHLTPLGDTDDFSLPPSRASSGSRIQSRRPSVSSGSDSDSEINHAARARAAKIMARQQPNPRHRRTSSGASAERKMFNARVGATSRQDSIDRSVLGPNMSRRGSVAPSAMEQTVRMEASVVLGGKPGATVAEVELAASRARLQDATNLIKAQIRAMLQECADRGDAQLCATVCCVIKDRSVDLPPFFVGRVTKAYIDQLRRYKLHVAAAGVTKYCATESIRTTSQNAIVSHTACGKCGKGLESTPYGVCSRCASQVARCCICNLIATSLYLFCATCGHGAHPACLDTYAKTLSERLTQLSPADVSHPSTPGLPTPVIRAWLWGETSGEDAELNRSLEDVHKLLEICPSGSCGHSPCILDWGL